MSEERPVCSCGKLVYTSVKDARRAHSAASWRVRVYRCPESGRLHVTNHEKHVGRWKDYPDAR